MRWILSWMVVFSIWSSGVFAAHKRIVILWISFGQGHKSAAQAIAGAIRERSPETEVILKDVRDFQPPHLRKMLGDSYDLLTRRLPDVYDGGFKAYMKLGERKEVIPQLAHIQNLPTKKILKWIRAQNASAILSTASAATEVLITLRNRGELNGYPMAWQHTDYVPEEYFAHLSRWMDMTFLPHASLREFWLAQGIDPSRVMTSGMPLPPSVFRKRDEAERLPFFKAHGLDPHRALITLMGGSAGVGSFTDQMYSIAEYCWADPIQLVVLTGRNKKQFQQVEEAKTTRRMASVPVLTLESILQEELFAYLRYSDVFVTKSGGLTPTEAAVIGTPMVLLDINGGQERFNANLFASTRLALVTDNQHAVGPLVGQLLHNATMRRTLKDNYAALAQMTRPEAPAEWALHASKVIDPGTGNIWAAPSVEKNCREELSKERPNSEE